MAEVVTSTSWLLGGIYSRYGYARIVRIPFWFPLSFKLACSARHCFHLPSPSWSLTLQASSYRINWTPSVIRSCCSTTALTSSHLIFRRLLCMMAFPDEHHKRENPHTRPVFSRISPRGLLTSTACVGNLLVSRVRRERGSSYAHRRLEGRFSQVVGTGSYAATLLFVLGPSNLSIRPRDERFSDHCSGGRRGSTALLADHR